MKKLVLVLILLVACLAAGPALAADPPLVKAQVLHSQAAYAQGGHAGGDLSVCQAHAKEILSLPMFAEITPEQIAQVARLIGEFYA